MSSKKIAILYGSETGNSFEFASILSYKLHRQHFAHTLSSFGNYNARDILSCRYMFIICSTTGQGDLPRNAKENVSGEPRGTLWSFLKRRDLPANFLSHLHVTMLGLGDSSYPKFNFAIRKFHKRMVNQLGANEIFPRLEADESGIIGSNGGTGTGVEAVYFEYEKRIVQYLAGKFPTWKLNNQVIKREEIPAESFMAPKCVLKLSTNSNALEGPSFAAPSSIKTGSVVTNKRITHEDHFQDVRQFVFRGESEFYEPGDTVALYPHNKDEDVQKFLEAQPHWKEYADKALELSGPMIDQEGGFVSPMTLRNLLKFHCEITSIPRKTFFMKTWMFATDKSRLEGGEEQLIQQRNKLSQFALEEDMDDLYDYCNRPRRSLLEVLGDFPSLKLPWEYALEYLPHIKPRLFSISSKPLDPEIELTVAIVKYKTILRKIRKGLCTDYLQALEQGDTVRYKLQRNQLLKPWMKSLPAVLISPGVGLAPMKCLIQSEFFGQIALFFGNRVKERDFLYENELTAWHKSGKIALYTCFSRDPLHSPKARYVQDVMWQNGEKLADLILNGKAIVYICGSSGKMPVQVRLTIIEILKEWGGLTENNVAEDYLKNMEKDDRYLQETW
ncbi:NAPDH-dependent diflavin reductase [Lachancea thermotolerans CBS 6340]|uniref:NADPH-dependent diflavin oxidoreductase 1 n=1 Tax=Lachancea thermotolerans (strain ATCC 56472 / CBS 6340 / NRRL Y-8284) TaxID=559295 RepID=C5DIS3_LACTC|nr:KLTH0E14762p [Lachancea thermotolerans CBS 6340]CAR23684.1 KLTH0E14762p [Lachancea thermotolerans CBS 6340]